LDTAWIKDIHLRHLSYAFSRLWLSVLFLCIWNKFSVPATGHARYWLHQHVAMIVHGLNAAIFFRGIFALAKSKQSRINRPGYFSCFFHYFGSYAYVEHIRHFINEVGGSSLPSLLSYTVTNRVSLRFPSPTLILLLF